MAELNDDFIELTSIVKVYTEEAAVAAIAKVKMDKEKAEKEAKEVALAEARRIAEEKERIEEKARKEEEEREKKVREDYERDEKIRLDKEREEIESKLKAKIEKERIEKEEAEAKIEFDRLALIEIQIKEAALLLIAEELKAKAEAEEKAEIARQEEAARDPYLGMTYEKLTHLIDENALKVILYLISLCYIISIFDYTLCSIIRFYLITCYTT